MFVLDQDGNFRADILQRAGVSHAFGSKASQNWPPTHGAATLKQTHSNVVWAADVEGCLGEGDALITNRSGLWVSVRTADCTPVLLLDLANRAVAAVHAGWRGTVAGIVEKTVTHMQKQFGTRPQDLLAAIGPAIGPCCYEVGDEVAEHFPLTRALRPRNDPTTGEIRQRWHIDVPGQNRNQLEKCGIPTAQIAVAGMCTACEEKYFWSFRRDQSQGRMVSGIRLDA